MEGNDSWFVNPNIADVALAYSKTNFEIITVL